MVKKIDLNDVVKVQKQFTLQNRPLIYSAIQDNEDTVVSFAKDKCEQLVDTFQQNLVNSILTTNYATRLSDDIGVVIPDKNFDSNRDMLTMLTKLGTFSIPIKDGSVGTEDKTMFRKLVEFENGKQELDKQISKQFETLLTNLTDMEMCDSIDELFDVRLIISNLQVFNYSTISDKTTLSFDIVAVFKHTTLEQLALDNKIQHQDSESTTMLDLVGWTEQSKIKFAEAYSRALAQLNKLQEWENEFDCDDY